MPETVHPYRPLPETLGNPSLNKLLVMSPLAPFEPAAREQLTAGETVKKLHLDAEMSEVYQLFRNRTPEGRYPEEVLNDVYANILTNAYEDAIPHGVSCVQQPRADDGEYYWCGMGSVEGAENGYLHHKLPFAHARVAEEIEEAIDVRERLHLMPHMAKVTISPRASEADASYTDAKAEHLHAADQIRIQYVVEGRGGTLHKRTESILAYDIPLEAWTKLLQDSNNPFGKSIVVARPDSALSVLATHRETFALLSSLDGGPVAILRAVLPYCDDPRVVASLQRQLDAFSNDQALIRQEAERVADQRMVFVSKLADSLAHNQTDSYITEWLDAHADQLKGQNKLLVQSRRHQNGYHMDVELARIANRINRTILWATLGVLLDTEAISQHVSPELRDKLKASRMFNKHAPSTEAGLLAQLRIMHDLNRQLATSDLKIGSGCSGRLEQMFTTDQASEKLRADTESLFGKEKYEFSRYMHCVVCDPAKKQQKTWCGPCGICRGCDAKLQKATK